VFAFIIRGSGDPKYLQKEVSSEIKRAEHSNIVDNIRRNRKHIFPFLIQIKIYSSSESNICPSD